MKSKPEAIESWIGETWDVLKQSPAKEIVDEQESRWVDFSREPLARVAIFGACAAGKSSLLKRLLVEFGVDVPEWLLVAGQRQTFKVDRITLDGFVIVDTPGLSSGEGEHDELTLGALQLADAYLWVMPPQLMTADREFVIGLMSGKLLSPSLPSRVVTGACLAAISRMDEAGADPEDDPAGYEARCMAKREELARALAEHGVDSQLRSVHTVAADPYASVGDLPTPEKGDYFSPSGWSDGVDELIAALRAIPGDSAQLRSLAGLRYTALSAQAVLDAMTPELHERRLGLKTCENEQKRIELQLAQVQAMLDEAQSSLEDLLETEFLHAERGLRTVTREGIEKICRKGDEAVQRWRDRTAKELDGLVEQILGEVKERDASPAMDRFFRLAGSEFVEPGTGAEVRRVIGVLKKVTPAVRNGVRDYAEAKLGKSLKQVAAQLKQASRAREGLAKGREAAEAARLLKIDAVLSITDVVLDNAGELIGDLERELAEQHHAKLRREFVAKLEAETDHVVNEEMESLRLAASRAITATLEERRRTFAESEKVLMAQVAELERAQDAIRQQLGQVRELNPQPSHADR